VSTTWETIPIEEMRLVIEEYGFTSEMLARLNPRLITIYLLYSFIKKAEKYGKNSR